MSVHISEYSEYVCMYDFIYAGPELFTWTKLYQELFTFANIVQPPSISPDQPY
jgi:hypothetical protein